MTGPVTLSAVGVSGDGTTKAFGFTIFKGMDTSTGAYNHHGAWNSGNNTQLGAPTAASLPGGGFNLTAGDIVAYSVGGTTPQNLNTITFNATAGQVYTIILGGYKNGGWTDTTDGYKLTISQAPSKYTLGISTTATGSGVSGTVTSNPAGINCTTGSTANCSADFNPNTQVTLTATAGSGSKLDTWGGACNGSLATCNVSMTQARSATANFIAVPTYALTVTKPTNGTITGSGITCGTNGSDCSQSFDEGTQITLTAIPDSGYQFGTWSGCSSTTGTSCTVNMTGVKTIAATFALIPPTQFPLTVTNNGHGTVTSTPSGINCGADCSQSFDGKTEVTLTAIPDSDYQFDGWGGACSGTADCKVTMTAARNVTATFAVVPPSEKFALTVTKEGGGKVTSSPAGIDCGLTCSFAFDKDANVSLTAAPDSGYTFDGWSGACTGTAGCSVAMTANKNVTATFKKIPPAQFALTVTNGGNGKVTSDPAGIDCGTDCTENFDEKTVATLTATPDSGFAFTGWTGGGCTGTGTCVVTMTAATSVTATFTEAPPAQYQLSVTNGGNGKVTSSPAGIDCGTSCNASFDSGTKVTLTATPDSSYQFTGWSGTSCSGTSTCEVTMDAARDVQATFALLPPSEYALSVTTSGNGKVTSNPTGIDCGNTCGDSFASGQTVTLTATPDTGYQFSGWAGACTNASGACTVEMNGVKDVTATFVPIPPPTQYTLSVGVTPTPPRGTVSGGGISCGSAGTTCTKAFDKGTKVTLSATPDSGYQFSGWSGACTNTSGDCPVDMNGAKQATATFTPIPPPSEYTLTVTNGGHGKVTSTPTGIDCGGTCEKSFPAGRPVTLIPTPDTGYQFSGWTGACTNSSGGCTVTMNAAKNVTATFTQIPPANNDTLTVSNGGHGNVTSAPAGISCGATCSAAFGSGQQIVLTATPDTGYQFAGWTGACTNASGTCSVTMDGAKNVGASFTAQTPSDAHTLTIANGGHGTVTSSPAGIDCGATCSETFPAGQQVTLTALADEGWRFSGWTGACIGTDACVVTMTEATNVGATFVLPPQRDFNGDGYADLFWRQKATGRGQLWLMTEGSIKSQHRVARKSKTWSLAATGDFNGDQQPDILWRIPATGQNQIWLMKSARVTSEAVLPDQVSAFKDVNTGDFDGDGQTDIVWHNPTTSEARLWLMQGTSFKSAVPLPTAPPDSRLSAVADFNGDGNVDIWWHSASTGQSTLWLMDRTSVQSTATPPVRSTSWVFAGTGLFDGDNKADVLWRSRTTNANQLWLMDGATPTATVNLPNMARAWFVADIDDFSGDGEPDVLWRNRKDGRNRLWLMDGTSIEKRQVVDPNDRGWVTP